MSISSLCRIGIPSFSKLAGQVRLLSARTEKIDKRIACLSKQVVNAHRDTALVREKAASLEGRIKSLETQVSSLKAQLATNATKGTKASIDDVVVLTCLTVGTSLLAYITTNMQEQKTDIKNLKEQIGL